MRSSREWVLDFEIVIGSGDAGVAAVLRAKELKGSSGSGWSIFGLVSIVYYEYRGLKDAVLRMGLIRRGPSM